MYANPYFIQGFVDRLTQFAEHEKTARGPVGEGGKFMQMLGDIMKFGPGGAVNALTAPLSIPMNLLTSAAGSRSDLSKYLGDESKGRGLMHLLLGRGSGRATERAAQELRDVTSPEELGALQQAVGKSSAPGRVGGATDKILHALQTLQAAGSGNVVGLAMNPLRALISANKPRERLMEGLGGDRPGFFRRWFDPAGGRAKGLGAMIAEQSPEFAEMLRSRMEAQKQTDAGSALRGMVPAPA